MEQKIELNLTPGTNEAIIREGKALELKPARDLVLEGNIDSVFDFLDVRAKLRFDYDQSNSNIVVNYDAGTIVLNINEHNHPIIRVTGKLEQSPKNKVIFVKDVSTIELSDIVKLNRHLFESPSTAMQLVTVLRNFKAKVEKEIENFKDDKGNFAVKRAQVVDSNCPDGFTVYLPPFKGMPKQPFNCEILVDANLNCTVVSPDYNQYIEETREGLLNEQVDLIKEIAPYIIIIKQ